MKKDLIEKLERTINYNAQVVGISFDKCVEILKSLQPTECVHPWEDIKQGYDRELKCEYVKCLKCKVVIERGFSSEGIDE